MRTRVAVFLIAISLLAVGVVSAQRPGPPVNLRTLKPNLYIGPRCISFGDVVVGETGEGGEWTDCYRPPPEPSLEPFEVPEWIYRVRLIVIQATELGSVPAIVNDSCDIDLCPSVRVLTPYGWVYKFKFLPWSFGYVEGVVVSMVGADFGPPGSSRVACLAGKCPVIRFVVGTRVYQWELTPEVRMVLAPGADSATD